MQILEDSLNGGYVALEAEMYDKAVEIFKQVLKSEPSNYLANSGAGRALLLSASNPDPNETELERGLKITEAQQLFEKAIKYCREPSAKAQLFFDLANSQLFRGELNKALGNYAQSLEIGHLAEGVEQKIYYLMGVINHENGYGQHALKNFEQAESVPGLFEDIYDISLRRCQIFLQQEKMGLAEEAARKLRFLAPAAVDGHQLLFQILVQQDNILAATDVLEEMKETFRDNVNALAEVHLNHALLHCLQAEHSGEGSDAHYSVALEWLKNAEEMQGLSESARFEVTMAKAEIEIAMGNTSSAIPILQEVSMYTKDELKPFAEKANYILLEVADQRGEHKKTEKHAEFLLTSEDVFYKHHAHYALANAQKMSDSPLKNVVDIFNNANAYFKAATAKEPGDFLALVYRIRLYADFGYFEEARQLCVQVLDGESKEAHMNYIRDAERSAN